MNAKDWERLVAEREDEVRVAVAEFAPAYRARWEEITALTDEVCRELLPPLAREYEVFCRALAAECCQKGSPVVEGQGKAAGWAAGVLWTIGMVNFLTDRSFEPVVSAKQVAAAFGASVATMQQKSREIREGLDIQQADPNWTLPSLYDQNPLIWLLETSDGLIIDIRMLPRAQQELVFEQGLIPYVPDESAMQT